jgi:hypothetical protein
MCMMWYVFIATDSSFTLKGHTHHALFHSCGLNPKRAVVPQIVISAEFYRSSRQIEKMMLFLYEPQGEENNHGD